MMTPVWESVLAAPVCPLDTPSPPPPPPLHPLPPPPPPPLHPPPSPPPPPPPLPPPPPPSEFVLDMISGYIRTQSYSIHNMEQRETEIRRKAEEKVNSSLSWPKRVLFNWVLYHARRGIDLLFVCLFVCLSVCSSGDVCLSVCPSGVCVFVGRCSSQREHEVRSYQVVRGVSIAVQSYWEQPGLPGTDRGEAGWGNNYGFN